MTLDELRRQHEANMAEMKRQHEADMVEMDTNSQQIHEELEKAKASKNFKEVMRLLDKQRKLAKENTDKMLNQMSSNN